MRTIYIALSLLSFSVFAVASSAEAQGLGACGDIHVEAEAQCEVIAPSVQCEASCTDLALEAACDAQLAADCDGMCNFTPPQNCVVDCAADCDLECSVDPGMFECAGSCEADCNGECAGSCSASTNRAECEAACEGTCSASCEGGCEGTPPSAGCDGKCEASCEASCEVEANLDCEIDCRVDASADCKLDVQGDCEADCQTEEGALFCDGDYVDHGDNLANCVAAIEAVIDANVEGYAEGSSRCEGGTCEAKGEAGVSCAVGPGHVGSGASLIALLGGMLTLVARRRRRS
jgi:hypothetical protein